MKALWLTLGFLAALPLLYAENPEPGAELIAQKIGALDDESYAVRERARHDLRKIGPPAVPFLLEAAKSDSPEKRIGAINLIHLIGIETLSPEFERLAKLPDAMIEVEEGMWLVARILDPALTRGEVSARLDLMAAAMRKELGEEVPPKEAPPARVVAALRKVLGEQFGLRGDTVTYNHPDNSSIHRVIERKRGLPILLSEIAVAVGRRLEVPIVGLAIPGRYMIKYHGAGAPAGQNRTDIIVNPYEDWKITTVAELERDVIGFDRRADLEPANPRMTLVRMLNNMHSDAVEHRKPRLAEAIQIYQSLLLPEPDFLPRFRVP